MKFCQFVISPRQFLSVRVQFAPATIGVSGTSSPCFVSSPPTTHLSVSKVCLRSNQCPNSWVSTERKFSFQYPHGLFPVSSFFIFSSSAASLYPSLFPSRYDPLKQTLDVFFAVIDASGYHATPELL